MKKTKPRVADETPLTRERIAAAAVALIEQEGLEGFSTRKLGEALGIEAMSIYHHFPSKGVLLDAVASAVLGHCEWPTTGAPLQRLAESMRRYRELGRRFPQSYPLLALRRLNSTTAFDMMEYLFGCLAELGFDAPMRAVMFRLLGHWLTGATLSELAASSRVPHSTPRVAAAQIDLQRYPRVRESTPYLMPEHFDVGFEFGLATMLATIESAPRSVARATRRRSRATSGR